MEGNQEYFAFISYQRQDEDWAKWLADQLEHYHLPLTINGRDDLPKDLRPIFRDIDELAAGNLPQQIHQALENSKNLIVICSPNSAKSPWVNKEVETFIGMGKLDNIFPFIIDGVPFSKNKDEECLPEALRKLSDDKERLGANVMEYKDGPQRLCKDCPLPKDDRDSKKQGDISDKGPNAAVVKIIAGMLDLNFDTLWQRYEKEKVEEERRIKEQRDKLLIAQSRFLAEKANDLVDKGDSYTARLLALEALPKDLENPDRPYVPEAEASLRRVYGCRSATFTGHNGMVYCARFSPNGHSLISASADNTSKIWDISTGKIIHNLTGHASYVLDAIYNNHGTIVATISFESIKIWDAFKGNLIYSFSIKTEGKSSLLFSPDDKCLVASLKDNISVWDLQSGTLKWKHQTYNYYHIIFSPSGNRLLSYSSDIIHIWDTTSWKLITSIESLDGEICDVSVDPFNENNYFVIIIKDCSLKFLETRTRKETAILKGTTYFHNNKRNKWGNNCFQVSYDFQKDMITFVCNNVVELWNRTNDILIASFKGHKDIVFSLDYSPEIDLYVTASSDKTIKLWSTEKEKKLSLYFKEKIDNTENIKSFCLCPCGNIIAASSNNNIILKEINSGKTLCTLEGYQSGINSVSYSPNGDFLVSASNDGSIIIWDANTKNLYKILKGHSMPVYTAFYSPKGDKIVSTSDDCTVRVWDAQTGDQLLVLKGHSDIVSYAVYSPTGKIIASASDDSTIILWNAESGEIMKTLRNHTYWISSVMFSADGSLLVSTAKDNTIRVWDVQEGKLLYTLDKWAKYAEFSPDGKFIIYVSDCVYIWNLESEKVVERFAENQGIISATFDTNGRHIITSTKDHIIQFWDFPSLQELIDQTYERFKNRQLTPEERKKYYLD